MFDKREKSFETKFVLQGEQEFKAKAMASKLFGLWAADKMGMVEEAIEAYTKSLIDISIENQDIEPIIKHVQHDFLEAGIECDKNNLENLFLEKLVECRVKLSN